MRSLGFAFALPLLFASVSVALGQPAPAPDAATQDAGAQDAAPQDAAPRDARTEDAAAQDASTGDAPTPAAEDAASRDADDAAAAPQGAAPQAAPAAEAPHTPSDVGLSLGLHVGYAVPFGRLKDVSIGDAVSGAIPVGIDVGYILEPRLYIGAYFSYAYAIASSSAASICPVDPNDTCSADWFRFGLVAHWHFLPKGTLDPWAGIALGYEVLNVTESDADGNAVSSAPSHGFELGLQGGVDYKPKSFYGFGPYLELSGGHYWGGDSGPFHGWFGAGLRLRTGI